MDRGFSGFGGDGKCNNKTNCTLFEIREEDSKHGDETSDDQRRALPDDRRHDDSDYDWRDNEAVSVLGGEENDYTHGNR